MAAAFAADPVIRWIFPDNRTYAARAMAFFGFLFAAIAFLGIPVAIGFRIAGEFVPGVTTTVIAVLLLGGIQLMAIGVIGEYLARVYDEVKRRPLYLVESKRNFDDAGGT